MSTDPYDLPLPPVGREVADRLASAITRQFTVRLVVLCSATIAFGTALAWYRQSPMIEARTGAVVTLISILHAFSAYRWSGMRDKVEAVTYDVFRGIAQKKHPDLSPDEALAMSAKRVDRSLPRLFSAVERRFVADHLAAAALGTVLWGFGDLVPF